MLNIAYAHASVVLVIFVIICYKISKLIDTHYTVWRRWFFAYPINEYLDKEELQKFYQNSCIIIEGRGCCTVCIRRLDYFKFKLAIKYCSNLTAL